MVLDFFNKSFITSRAIEELINNSIDKYDNCIWIKGVDGDYLAVNSRLCEELQIERDEMLSRNCKDIFYDKSYRVIIQDDADVIKYKRKSIINQYMKIKGKEFILYTHKLPIINPDGSCTSFFAIAKKIDEIKVNSENYLEDGNFNVKIINNESQRQRNNHKDIIEYMKELYEYPSVEGLSLWILMKKNTLKKMMSMGILENSVEKNEFNISRIEKDFIVERYKNISKSYSINKEEFYGIDNLDKCSNDELMNKNHLLIPLINESIFLGVLNIYCNNYTEKIHRYLDNVSKKVAVRVHNISLSNKLSLPLAKKIKLEEEMQIFLKIATDLGIIFDYTGRIKRVSSNAIDLLGWSKEELKKKNMKDIVDLTDKSISYKEIEENYNKKCYGGILKIKCRDGSIKIMEWYYYNEKATKQIYLMGKEVSAIFQLQNKIKELEEKINHEAFKTDFLANISHEFKTPLNIILSAIQLITLNNESELRTMKEFKYLNSIKQNSYRLLRLINNLIDVTKIEDGKLELYRENINIIYFIKGIVESINPYIVEMKRNLIFETEKNEVILACDLEKVEKIILNLISNAIKYTGENGNILIRIYTNVEEDRIYILVKDDGVGISSENKYLIFEKFKQLDNTLSRRAEGSGIGLPLVKSFVEIHGGNIYLDSKVGEGSEFTFYLPIEAIEDIEVKIEKSKILDSKIDRFNIEFSDIYA